MKRIAMITLLLSMVLAGPAFASTPAFDDASDPVYDDGWDDGDDGGSGWLGGWTGLGDAGLVTTSTLNGDGDDDQDGDIDTSGRAWAFTLTAAGVPANVVRRLDGPLEVGQSITVQMDHDAVLDPGTTGIRLTSSVGEQRFVLSWFGSQQDYLVLDDGFQRMNVPYTDEGLTIVFSLTGVDSYSVDLTPIGGSTETVSGQLATGVDISNLILNAIGNGTPQTFFFNSIVVPEPGPRASAAAAFVALLLCVRRPRSRA